MAKSASPQGGSAPREDERFFSVSAYAVVEGDSGEEVEDYLRDILRAEPGFHDVSVGSARAVRRAGAVKAEASSPMTHSTTRPTTETERH